AKQPVAGAASVNAADFLVGRGTYETLFAAVFGGIYAGSAGYGLLGATVVAEIRTVRDVPLTIYANHGFTSTERCFVRLALIRVGMAKSFLFAAVAACVSSPGAGAPPKEYARSAEG